MNFIEYHEKIISALPNLNLKTSYISGNPDFQYDATELIKLKQAINGIEDIPYIQGEIYQLKKSWLFNSSSDNQKINSTQNFEVDNAVKLIVIKLKTFKEIAETSKLFDSNETILIRIPEIQSFDNL